MIEYACYPNLINILVFFECSAFRCHLKFNFPITLICPKTAIKLGKVHDFMLFTFSFSFISFLFFEWRWGWWSVLGYLISTMLQCYVYKIGLWTYWQLRLINSVCKYKINTSQVFLYDEVVSRTNWNIFLYKPSLVNLLDIKRYYFLISAAIDGHSDSSSSSKEARIFVHMERIYTQLLYL